MKNSLLLPACLLAVSAFTFGLSSCDKKVADSGDSPDSTPAVSESGATPIPLAHEDTDLSPDSAVTWGVLDNGLRYAILPNPEPPNRVSLRLYVDAGSLMEEADQEGLAHFLEHMAFNGTKNFAANSMVEYFQRMGMGFGNHTNAHTWFRETVYKLELPNTEGATLGEAFKLLRDDADGMLLAAEEIDKERGIILSEKRSRDSVNYRTFVEQLKFIVPDGLISKRITIGQEEDISNAPRERFVDFYQKWYTPDRMAVVVVGGIEPEPIAALIEEHFGDMKAPESKRPLPDMGSVSKRGVAVHFHPEPEAGEVSVSIDTIKPRENPPDNKERRARDLRLGLANAMLSRRLDKIAKKEDSPIKGGSGYYYDLYDLQFAEYAGLDVRTTPENWQAGLALAEQELRRALEHGFTDAELTEAKANVENRAKIAAESMATRKSSDLSSAIVRTLSERRVFTSPAEDLPRIRKELESVTADETRELLGEIWDGSHEILLLVTGNVEIEEADQTILTSYNESKAVGVEPLAEETVKAFAYAELPEHGKIAERKEIEDLEVTQIRFENNVRVNLKVTDFEDETIYVKARVGGGKLTEPKDRPGLAMFASMAMTDGGLEAHSMDDIKQIFAGKSVGAGFSVEDDAFSISGRTTPADLRDQLLLMRASLTSPGFRPEAQLQFRRSLDHLYQQVNSTPQGVLQNEGARYVRSGDPRFGFPDQEAIAVFTMDDLQGWLADPLQNDYLELTVVGDFDKEKTIETLAATFGSLPGRAAEKPAYAEEREVLFPRDAEAKTLGFKSSIDKGMAVVYWPTEDIFDIERTRRIGVLGSILDDRLRIKIREELGDAYSPSAHNVPSDTFKDYGYLFAAVTVDPAQAEKVAGVIREIAADIGKGDTITEDELERAKKPQLTQIEEYRRTNGYWLGSVLEASQEYPQRIEWSRTFVSDYENIALKDVQELAKTYFGGYAGLQVIVAPE